MSPPARHDTARRECYREMRTADPWRVQYALLIIAVQDLPAVLVTDNDTGKWSMPSSDRLPRFRIPLDTVAPTPLNQTFLPDLHHWAQTLFPSSSKRLHFSLTKDVSEDVGE